MKTKIILSTFATASFLFMGCGGGGGIPQAASQKNITIKGIANDDLILNGIITATDIAKVELKKGRTSRIDGSYILSLPYNGMIFLNVACQEGNSTMLNPTTHSTQACGENITLNSLAEVKAGETLKIHISPLSEITYQRARALSGSGSISSATFAQARSDMTQMFGVDPIAANPTRGIAAAIIDTIHVRAKEKGRSVIEITTDLSRELNDGVADGISDTETQALTALMMDANISNQLTDNNGSFAPIEVDKFEAKKEIQSFIKEIRTQTKTIQAYADSETQAMGDAARETAFNIEQASNYVVDIYELVSEAYEEGNNTYSGIIDDIYFGGMHYALINATVTQMSNTNRWEYVANLEGNHTYRGSITLPEPTENILYDFNNLHASFQGELPFVRDARDEENRVIKTQTVSLDIALVRSGEITHATLSDVSIESEDNKISIDQLKGEIKYRKSTDDKLIFDYLKLESTEVSAKLGDYLVNGTLAIPEYTINTTLAPNGGTYEAEVTYANIHFHCSEGSLILNAATLELDGVVYNYGDRYGWDQHTYFSVDSIPGVYSREQVEDASTIDASCSNNGTLSTTYYAGNHTEELFANSGILPKKITFEGTVENSQTGGKLEATINTEWTNASSINLLHENNFLARLDFKMQIAGKLQMPQKPDTLINLEYERKSNNARSNTIKLSYAHDISLLNVQGNIDDDLKSGEFTLDNGGDIQANFKLDNGHIINGNKEHKTGSLIINKGLVIATIEERGDLVIIKYIDGTFETIF